MTETYIDTPETVLRALAEAIVRYKAGKEQDFTEVRACLLKADAILFRPLPAE